MPIATRSTHSLTHEPNFKTAINSINRAVQRAVGTSKKYANSAALSLRWQNDDLELGPITTELLDTFKILYGFKTESYIIPATMSHVDAMGVDVRVRYLVTW
jgi:hypothetical protein